MANEVTIYTDGTFEVKNSKVLRFSTRIDATQNEDTSFFTIAIYADDGSKSTVELTDDEVRYFYRGLKALLGDE